MLKPNRKNKEKERNFARKNCIYIYITRKPPTKKEKKRFQPLLNLKKKANQLNLAGKKKKKKNPKG
jgi:hypothetical protein